MILQPCKINYFPVSYAWNWKFMVKNLTMQSTISIKISLISKHDGNFDHLKISLVAYLNFLAWNWPYLQMTITDILRSSLIFFVNLPFSWNWPVLRGPVFVKLTRFCETGLPIFPVSHMKVHLFLCENTSFWPVFVKKWGFKFSCLNHKKFPKNSMKPGHKKNAWFLY